MLNIDDMVVYGSNGVCRVTEIKNENFAGEVKKYFVLKPVFDDKNTYFVPSFNELLMSRIRPVMSRDEAMLLIQKIPKITPNWIDNDKARGDMCKRILENGTHEEIIAIGKAISERKLTLVKKGKRLRNTDEAVLRNAQALIETECAFVLGITQSEAAELLKI